MAAATAGLWMDVEVSASILCMSLQILHHSVEVK